MKEFEKKDKYLDLAGELKKIIEHEGDNYTNGYWYSWYSHQRIVKGTGGLENKRTIRDHPNYNIVEIGQNTEKNPRDLRRLVVTRTSVKDHQLTLISTGRLCGDRDETINHIISECCKLSLKEYKARHDCVGKVIYWEMCKKFKFDHANKGYMHNPAPVLENDTHKHLWDFYIQTDHLISARRPELIIINRNKKENLQNCRLCCPG